MRQSAALPVQVAYAVHVSLSSHFRLHWSAVRPGSTQDILEVATQLAFSLYRWISELAQRLFVPTCRV